MGVTTGLTGFIWFILHNLLWLLTWVIIVNAVASWLIVFNVVNPRNRAVNMILRTLDAVTRPILWPLRRIIPSLGGLDVTPIIAILIIQGIDGYLLPPLMGVLYRLIG